MWYYSLSFPTVSVPDYTQVSVINQEQVTAVDCFLSRYTSQVQVWKKRVSLLLKLKKLSRV